MKATELYRKHNGENSTKWACCKRSQALQRNCDGISGSIKDRQDQGTCYWLRNQGRQTLLSWNAAAELSSARHSSAVRRGVRFPAGWCSIAPGDINGQVSAAKCTQLPRAFCLADEQSGHKPHRLCCRGCSAARCVQSSDHGLGGSQRQSAYLLGQSRSTTDQESYWSVATKI